MKIRILFLFIVFANIYSLSFSQITFGDIEKQKNTTLIKPEPYDSLKNFSYHNDEINYKQYIGLQFYLPPYKNPVQVNIKQINHSSSHLSLI